MRGGFGGRVGLAGRGGFGYDRALLLRYGTIVRFSGELIAQLGQEVWLEGKGVTGLFGRGGLTGFWDWEGVLSVRRFEGRGHTSVLLNHVGDRGQLATGFPMHLAGEMKPGLKARS